MKNLVRLDFGDSIVHPGRSVSAVIAETSPVSGIVGLPALLDVYKRQGESRTGDLVFVVPSSQTNFTLEYLEIYEDEFEGNTFKISFDAQQEAQ